MTCARLLEPLVDEPLVDVLEHDRQVGGGKRLGDLAAHRAGADDGRLENEHVWLKPPSTVRWSAAKPICCARALGPATLVRTVDLLLDQADASS